MGNTYEFKIDEIKEVIICNKASNNFTTIWRREDTNNPEFIEKYASDPDGDKYICIHCGSWSEKNVDEDCICEVCNNERVNTINESDVIDCIYEFLNPDDFKDTDIYINGILIK